jgi:hypothetical protein
MAVTALILIVASRSTPTPPAWGFRGFPLTFGITFAVVGATIASLRPWNVIGWLMCGAGLQGTAQGLVFEYAFYAVVVKPDSLPGGEFLSWVDSWLWVMGLGVAGTLLPLLFPNGRLMSPKWRLALWYVLGSAALGVAGRALAPGPLDNFPSVRNPFGMDAIAGFPLLGNLALMPVLGAIVISVTSFIVRFQGVETRVERHQLKWFAYAGVLFAAAVVINQTELAVRGTGTESVTDLLVILGVLGVSISVGIAILRYRLYEIDVVINRTLVYIPLTAVLAGLYLAAVGLFKTLFADITGQTSDAAVAFTTLMVVSLFTPVKNSLQGVVDRYVKEAPDASRNLNRYGEQVRMVVEALDREQIARRFLDEAASAFQAEPGAMYLMGNGSNELVCTYGAWNETVGVTLPLEVDGHGVGELRLAFQTSNRRFTQPERAALEQCAGTVAQALMLAGR